MSDDTGAVRMVEPVEREIAVRPVRHPARNGWVICSPGTGLCCSTRAEQPAAGSFPWYEYGGTLEKLQHCQLAAGTLLQQHRRNKEPYDSL